MTDKRELDHLLTTFMRQGTDELPDRVIDAVLDEIDHTHQRRALGPTRRFSTMTTTTRLAAAAVIGALAIGGAIYLTRPSQPTGTTSSPTPGASASSSLPSATPFVRPTAKPDPMALAGPLGDGRQIHTATVLADGRVLVLGGYDWADQPIASAVLFDPATNTFRATGSMATPRGEQTATLLPDGHVLVAGGGIAMWAFEGAYLSSAELFDPAAGTFSATGSMAVARQGQTATSLADGRVVIIGGADTKAHSLASAEIYDPTTGRFSATGSMASARAWHTATTLADGRILVVGGLPNALATDAELASAEIYDPATGTFSATGSMTTGRAFNTATLLADGRVLLTGGATLAGDSAYSAETFDPATGTFAQTGQLTFGRMYQTATLLSDGRVLVAGGGGDYTDRRFLSSAELFVAASGTFVATGPMTEPRTNHMATLLRDGRVLLTGGYGDLAPLASAEIYDPVTGTFSAVR